MTSCLFSATGFASNIGKVVWRDSDGDGVRDAGEPGVVNARVRLYIDHNGDGFPERKVSEALTDANGNYLFTNVSPGTYSVGIDLLSLPENLYEITPRDVGSNESIDSDVDQHITRSEPFNITSTGQDFTDRGDIGLLPGDGNVTYWGVQSDGNHLYTYQDLYLRTSHPALPAGETRSHFDLNSKWIKWYATATRRQQMVAKKPGWLDTQRQSFAPDGVNFSQYRGVLNGVGEGSTGYLDGRGYWTGGADYNEIINHPDEVGPHTITIYEGYRGTPARILWRTTSNEEVLFPWLMTSIETYIQSGNQASPPQTNSVYPTVALYAESLDAWERRVNQSLFTDVFFRRYGLLQSTNLMDVNYLPAGSSTAQTTQLRSQTILIAILQKVMVEQGHEKFEEAMDNLSLVKFWPSSVELSAINFKKAINDATDGIYDSKFDNDWGFPLADTYVPVSGIDSGSYVEQDIYRWHFASDGDTNIPSGYSLMTNQMTQGMARFTSPINEVGYVDVNERGNILGRPLYYTNDAYSHVIAGLYDLSWAHQVKNGYWAVSIDSGEKFEELKLEGQSYGGYSGIGSGYDRLGLNYIVEVTDGELNVEFPRSAPPAQIKYFGGFSLHYLGASYTPASSMTAQQDLNKYNYNFGGDLLLTEPAAGYTAILPSYTDSNGTFWWRPSSGNNRAGVNLSEAYHFFGLQEVKKTGVMTSDGGDASFSHKVKNGLWRVSVGVANVESQVGYSLSAEGGGLGNVSLGNQEHKVISGYVGVADGQLDIDVQGTGDRLIITSLELSYVSPNIVALSGFVEPDLVNTASTGGENPWFGQTNQGPAWRERIFDGKRVVTADEAFPQPNNDYYQLVTTIDGLEPNATYAIGLEYGAQNNWAIKAGLNPGALQGYARTDFVFGSDNYIGTSSGMVEQTGKTIASIPVYRANLGSVTADANGEIKVYVDDPNNAGVNSDANRAWFVGVSYSLVDFEPIQGLRFSSSTPADESVYLAGDDISVELTADVTLSSASLYRNGVLVRTENGAPWQWGESGQNDLLLKGLPEGSYEYRAEVVAADGTADQISFTVNVITLDYVPNSTADFVEPSALNTKAVDGRSTWFATGNAPPLWKYREDYGVFSADEGASGSNNDYIKLNTTLFGLTPGASYEVFIEFGSNGDWAIMGGLSPDSIEGFAATNKVIGANQHIGVNDASGRVTQLGRTLDGFPVYRASLGTAVANANGTIEVFIDDPDNAGASPVDKYRAWYDGVYYSQVGSPPVDTTPPTPNAATFASAPSADSDSAISMTATTGTDASGPVEYLFTETSGNPGGASSGWQTSPSYTDTGLTASTQYSYTLTMRDALGNTGNASTVLSATTQSIPSATKLVRTTVNGVSSSTWSTVNLGQSYNSAVIIATPIYPNNSSPSVVTRIRNVTANSFEVKLDRADGQTGAVQFDVSVIAVEEGVYTQAAHGVTMEAVKYNSTVTARKNSWSAESRTFQNSYTNPVVVGQVLSANDAGWSAFWSMGSSRTNPVDSSNLNVGKHVGEDTDGTRANETIGYIVIESGSGTIDGVTYEAGLGSDTVLGFVNSSTPYTYNLSGGLSSASAAAVSISGLDGGDGGWAVLAGAPAFTASSIGVYIAEDQIGDSERWHTSEQVSYLVFE